jgi:hypothetical protein
MQRIASALIVLTMTFGGYAAHADSKANDLLAQARAAIGGDKQIAKVKGLTFGGTVVRAMGDRQMSGELSIDLQLPDKMVRTDSISPMGDSALVVTEQGLNGDALIRSSKVLNAPAGAMIRTPPAPAPGSDAETQALRNSRAELARMAVGLLVMSPAALPVEFSYAGEAESPDGKADVIDVKGEGGFVAKLFLDKTTHRPLMLAYRGVSPRMVVQTQRVQGPPPAAPPGGAAHAEPGAPPAPELVDINMFFDDYKAIDGVMLPHHITRSVDGQPTEEWTFKTIKVNPAFKPDTFSRR